MAQRNLGEVYNEVLRKTSRRPVETDPATSPLDQDSLNRDQQLVLDYVNNALSRLWRQYPWFRTKRQDSFDTEDGTAEYVLAPDDPVDPAAIQWMGNMDLTDLDLHQITDKEFRELKQGVVTQGQPDFFRIKEINNGDNPVIELYPTPEQVYTIEYEYHMAVPRVSEAQDLVVVNPELVMWKAVVMLREHDGDESATAREEYREELVAEKKRQDTSIDIVVGRQGSNRRRNQPREPSLPNKYQG